MSGFNFNTELNPTRDLSLQPIKELGNVALGALVSVKVVDTEYKLEDDKGKPSNHEFKGMVCNTL